MATGLLERLQRFNPFTKEEKGTLYSEKDFHLIFKRECARAERSGRAFAIVVFNVGSAADRQLAQALAQRLRETDAVGWIGKYSMGVLLADTADGEEAKRFICGIRNMLSTAAPLSECEVYVYPSDWKNPIKTDVVPWPLPLEKSEDVRSLLLANAMPLWKRMTDIMISSLVLFMTSPLLVLIALYIKTISPGPILFKQKRVGYLGRHFMIWKFRTMEANCDVSKHKEYVKELLRKDKPMTKQDNNPHIIPLGNILRKSCVDELPQLINVLRGEMSLVGPRPDVPYAVESYQPWHHARTDVFPGMTGLWQVSGKNKTTYHRMMGLDIAYTRQKSFWLDMKILAATPISIMEQVKDGLVQKLSSRKGRLTDFRDASAIQNQKSSL